MLVLIPTRGADSNGSFRTVLPGLLSLVVAPLSIFIFVFLSHMPFKHSEDFLILR